MIYLISDHHFGHTNIIKYCDRPFSKDNQGMVKNAEFMYNAHQETVTENDIVIFLGDVALFRSHTKEDLKRMLKALKGKKFLVLGNHDTMSLNFYKECGFVDVQPYYIIGDVMLCHYPLLANTDHPELRKIMLDNKIKTLYHGHIHNKDLDPQDGIERFNFSVEKINYTPKCVDNPLIQKYFENLHLLLRNAV